MRRQYHLSLKFKISHSSVEQKAAFINENVKRLSDKINSLDNEKESINDKIKQTAELIKD